MKILRSAYMNKEVSYREYYGQFVTESVMRFVVGSLTKRELTLILAAIAAGSEHLSSDDTKVPLRTWDNMQHAVLSIIGRKRLTEVGENASISTGVCIAKEAVKMYAELLKKID